MLKSQQQIDLTLKETKVQSVLRLICFFFFQPKFISSAYITKQHFITLREPISFLVKKYSAKCEKIPVRIQTIMCLYLDSARHICPDINGRRLADYLFFQLFFYHVHIYLLRCGWRGESESKFTSL